VVHDASCDVAPLLVLLPNLSALCLRSCAVCDFGLLAGDASSSLGRQCVPILSSGGATASARRLDAISRNSGFVHFH
jgi:hypothetical protein